MFILQDKIKPKIYKKMFYLVHFCKIKNALFMLKN